MSRFPRLVARLLLFSLFLFTFLGVGCWVLGVEAAPDASPPLRSTLNALPVSDDPHVVRGPAWMDRNGDRVDDRLEQRYRRDGKAGLQQPGAPPVADVMICLDHAPTAADLARCQ